MKHQISSVIGFLEFVYKTYPHLKNGEITLIYDGEINQQITKTFSFLTEANMEMLEERDSVQRKVFHVMVECLQNISKHADIPEQKKLEHPRGIFLVIKGDDFYNIISGNIVDNDKVAEMKQSLDMINKLDKDELKLLYREQIQGKSLTIKSGAGLGFIDIVRKTGEKLFYWFISMDEKYSFFILNSTIPRN